MEKAITIGEVVSCLDSLFLPELQEDYDNAGFLLGNSGTKYHGALVALDLTPAVLEEALAEGLNLIVTHHPFIFTGLKRITDRTEAGRMTMALIENGIAVYAAHTNLDNLPWGVNGILSEKLGLQDARILRSTPSPLRGTPPVPGGEQATQSVCCPPETGELSEGLRGGLALNEIGAGMVGELPRAMEADKFLLKVKELTRQPSIRTSAHNPKKKVKRIALCGGAGSFLISDAIAADADIFITADLKYHDFQRGEGRIILADAGHYETEQFAKEIIYRAISEKFSNFACRISENQESLVLYI